MSKRFKEVIGNCLRYIMSPLMCKNKNIIFILYFIVCIICNAAFPTLYLGNTQKQLPNVIPEWKSELFCGLYEESQCCVCQVVCRCTQVHDLQKGWKRMEIIVPIQIDHISQCHFTWLQAHSLVLKHYSGRVIYSWQSCLPSRSTKWNLFRLVLIQKIMMNKSHQVPFCKMTGHKSNLIHSSHKVDISYV